MTLTYLTMAIVALGALQGFLSWKLLRGLRRLDKADARLGHLTEALRLLAETSEAGFRASAQELARVADRMAGLPAVAAAPAVQPARAARPRAHHAATVARKPRQPKAAAPVQEMSESEARLRLLLAEKTAASQMAAREAGRGALRA